MRNVLAVVGFGLAIGVAGPSAAHAFLQQASPRVGSAVTPAPNEVRLSFSEPLEIAFSRFTVTGPPGFGGLGPVSLAANDRRVLTGQLRGPTPSGRYTVHWRVVSIDGHATEGDFHFDVKP
jgi:methionine-rich copper-binding protein CopC